MRIARIFFPVKTLGPGNRVGIWTAGCNRECSGCANPELWDFNGGGAIEVKDILQAVYNLTLRDSPKIDGITITGGEPFLQALELQKLVLGLQMLTQDILVYTGYMREELQQYEETIIKQIAVLVDGPYIQNQNETHPLMGSQNQRIHYIRLDKREQYEIYIQNMNGTMTVQNFQLSKGKACIGIHKSDFMEEYKKRSR